MKVSLQAAQAIRTSAWGCSFTPVKPWLRTWAWHLLQADRFVRTGGWQEQWRVETPAITGKRLGILGLGNIGSRIAQRVACGFDMEIGYHNRAAVAGSPYCYFANLIELATWADFLVAAAPGRGFSGKFLAR